MNASPVKTIARQVGLWSSLVLVVVLCSLLFSLLGTLCTAVAGGLIMGASRRWKWQTIPVSVVFPLAGLSLAQAAKADLDTHQRFIAAAVSFGAFWGTYVLTILILLMEKSDKPDAPRAAMRDKVVSVTGEGLPRQERGGHRGVEATRAIGAPASAGQFSLGDLQGTWLCETNGLNGQGIKRRLEIAGGTFALNVTDSDGETHLAAQGDLKLEGADGTEKLLIRPERDREPLPPG